jgi:5-methylcytosine-specific restriction endonuclease McrA
MNYQEQLKDERWLRRRIEILKRDRFRCQQCDYFGDRVNVHHLRYTGMAWEAPDEDLITLCYGCHGKAHSPDIKDKKFEDMKLNSESIILAILNKDGEKIY